MAEGKRLSANSIKSILKPIWRRKKDIRPQDVFYIRKKDMNPLPVLRFNPSHDSLKEAENISAFLGGRDDEIDIDNDTTKKIAFFG